MEIEIKLDKTLKEPRVEVHAPELNAEVRAVLQKLDSTLPEKIVGFQGEMASILPPEEILRVYAESQKTCAETNRGVFVLRMRLYEAENILAGRDFARISHSEMVNFSAVEDIDLSFSGTICMKLQNGKSCYVSRRYLPKIKTLLGL